MNYKLHYDNLMNTRMLMKKERYLQKKEGKYFEGHHIVPKCKGGTGTSSKGLNSDNIVYLTAREHFIAHWLLWRIYRDRQTALSFHKMISNNKNQNRIFSSKGYEEAKIAFSITNKGNKYGLGKTKLISEEHKKAISKFMKGRWAGDNNPFYGKKHSEETRKLLSEKAKLKVNFKNKFYKGEKLLFKDGIFIREFKNIREVAEYIGGTIFGVKNVLGGSQKTTRGYYIKHKLNTN